MTMKVWWGGSSKNPKMNNIWKDFSRTGIYIIRHDVKRYYIYRQQTQRLFCQSRLIGKSLFSIYILIFYTGCKASFKQWQKSRNQRTHLQLLLRSSGQRRGVWVVAPGQVIFAQFQLSRWFFNSRTSCALAFSRRHTSCSRAAMYLPMDGSTPRRLFLADFCSSLSMFIRFT